MPSTGKHRLQAFGVQAQQGDRRRRRDVQVTLRLSASCAYLQITDTAPSSLCSATNPGFGAICSRPGRPSKGARPSLRAAR